MLLCFTAVRKIRTAAALNVGATDFTIIFTINDFDSLLD